MIVGSERLRVYCEVIHEVARSHTTSTDVNHRRDEFEEVKGVSVMPSYFYSSDRLIDDRLCPTRPSPWDDQDLYRVYRIVCVYSWCIFIHSDKG